MLLKWQIYATIMLCGGVIYLAAPLQGWGSKWFARAFAIGAYTIVLGGIAWILDFIWSI